jgi:hypothetical protein
MEEGDVEGASTQKGKNAVTCGTPTHPVPVHFGSPRLCYNVVLIPYPCSSGNNYA